MMAEKLFPQRQRCKTCSKGLGLKSTDPVYLGLYCTPRCAGIAAPATRPEGAPRECTTVRDGKAVFKRKYRSDSEVPDKILQDPSTGLYWCSHCAHRHAGHSRMGEAESLRVFRSPEDLRDLLVKRRGQASVADVAKAAGVRPIRLKELEAGIKHEAGLDTLFKVLAVLRVDLAGSIRPMR